MADIHDFPKLRSHVYSDEDGYVHVFASDGNKPSRGLLFRLLARARKALLERDK